MKPAIVEAELDIDRSAEDVFDYCSDHSHEPEWNPKMKRIEKVTDGPLGVGTRYTTEFVSGPSMVLECVKFEPPSTWSLVGSSPVMNAVGEGKVVPTAKGAHLMMRMEIEPRGALKLALPLVRHRLCSDFAHDVQNIKTILEQEGPSEGAGIREARGSRRPTR